MTTEALTWRQPRAAGRVLRSLAGTSARQAYAAARAWAAAHQPHRAVPAAGGSALIAWGASQIYTPAGYIAGGIVLLILDSRMP